MKNFGIIIRYFREKSNISMSSLAEGICTKHYVYLIESGKRIPSIKVIDELSSKLNFDWREYVDFADNPSPLDAKNLIQQIETFNQAFDFESLHNLIDNLPETEWVSSHPVNIEVMIQKSILCIISKEDNISKFDKEKDEFMEFISPYALKSNFSDLSLIYLKSLNVYASLLVKQGQSTEAFAIFKKLIEALDKKKHIKRYQSLYVTTNLNAMNCYMQLKEYKKMHNIGISLIKYQENFCLLDKLPLTLILVGDSFKYLNKKTTAYKFYKQALGISKVIKNNHLRQLSENRFLKLY